MAAGQNQAVPIYGLADMKPAYFDVDKDTETADAFFNNFLQWVNLHQERLANEVDQVKALRFCLSGQALAWFQDLIDKDTAWEAVAAANRVGPHPLPQTLRELKTVFLNKFWTKLSKTAIRREISSMKYTEGRPVTQLVTRFQYLAEQLKWPLDYQKTRFTQILPKEVRHFVAMRPMTTFDEIVESVNTYQDMIESVDGEVHHVFKNVTFEESECSICKGNHPKGECPVLERLVQSKLQTLSLDQGSSSTRSSRSPARERDGRRSRSFSPNRSGNSYGRSRSPSPTNNRDRRNFSRGRRRDRYDGNTSYSYQNRNNRQGRNRRGFNRDYRNNFRNQFDSQSRPNFRGRNNRFGYRGNRGYSQQGYSRPFEQAYYNYDDALHAPPLPPNIPSQIPQSVSSFTTSEGHTYAKVIPTSPPQSSPSQNF